MSKSKKQERDHQLAFYQEKVREQEFIISSLTSELAAVTARLEEYRAIGLTYITE